MAIDGAFFVTFAIHLGFELRDQFFVNMIQTCLRQRREA